MSKRVFWFREMAIWGCIPSGAFHFDDGGTSAPSYVSFTTGGIFDVLSFDLTPVGFNSAKPFKNVALIAHYATGLIQGMVFQMDNVGDTSTISLGSMFTNLTQFAIAIVNTPPFDEPDSPNGNYCFDYPCSHFNVDNVSVNFVAPATVPLPAGLILLASAIAGLGFVRRWQKS